MIIPENPDTENKNSQESGTLMCQRQPCPNQGKIYQQAIRRCTIETTQKVEKPVTLYGVTFMTILNGLAWPSRRITVDLCVACYHIIQHDKTIQMLSIRAIGPDAEVL